MSPDLSSGKSVSNRDIYVAEAILQQFPGLGPILNNREIKQAFAAIDRVARRRKSIFTKLGTVSLILVCAVLVVLAWRLTLAGWIEFPAWVEELSAAAGLIAVGIQLFLLFSRLHRKWIYARFMAERMRQWKFQTLLDGELISRGVSHSPDQFSHELKQRWGVFYEGFKHGIGGMNEFIESQPPEPIIEPTPYADHELLDQARRAFIQLRLDVQISHYEDMNARLEPLDKLTDSWAKVLLGLSGIIAVIEACLVAVHLSVESYHRTTAILAGLALSFAIISAAIRVYRGAAMLVEERERYHTKQLHLKRVKNQLTGTTDRHKILSLMEEAETVCSEELQDFIRALRRADYFL